MSTRIAGISRLYLWASSLAVIGAWFLLNVLTGSAGPLSLPEWLQLIGGVGLLASGLWQAVDRTPDEYDPGRNETRILLLAAILTLLGGLLTALGSMPI